MWQNSYKINYITCSYEAYVSGVCVYTFVITIYYD